MTIISIFGWVCVAVVAMCAWLFLFVFVKLREISNNICAAASKEFFESVESLLSASNEIPSVVLDGIELMNWSARDAIGQKALLTAFRKKKNQTNATDGTFQNAVEQMRPELKELFGRTVVSWLNYVSHQSVLMNVRLRMASSASIKNVSDPTTAEREMGFKLINRLEPRLC